MASGKVRRPERRTSEDLTLSRHDTQWHENWPMVKSSGDAKVNRVSKNRTAVTGVNDKEIHTSPHSPIHPQKM